MCSRRKPTPGGAARTMELTLPGFLHDFGSAVHPLARGFAVLLFAAACRIMDWNGFIRRRRWRIRSMMARLSCWSATSKMPGASLGVDGKAWAKLMRPFVDHWREFAPEVLRPVRLIPRHPLLMARFGLSASLSAQAIAQRFRSERTRALFAGLAAHSFLALDEPLSGAFGMLMAVPRARRRMADSARRIAIDHECAVQLLCDIRRQR